MWEKMGTDLVAKGNDVYYANSHDYMPGGPIELLDPWIERDKYPLDEFIPGYADSLYAYTYDTGDTKRRYYSMPLIQGSAPMIFFDREIFANYGVEPPSETPTPEEILDKAKKLTGKDPKTGKQTYGFYLPIKGAEFTWVALMNAYGGEVFDDFEKPTKAVVTQEPGKKAVAWYLEMEKAKVSGDDTLAHGTDLNSAPEFLTANNQYAMGVGNPAFAVATASLGLQKKVGAVQFFKNKEGKGGNPGGVGLMMHRGSAVKGDAWELMKFLNNEENHRWRWTNWAFFSTRKFMPTRRIVKWRVAVMPHVQGALAGQKTPDQALQDMERELTEIVSAPGP
jgi:multiple sugar transport system substrate-binding protein